MSSTELDLRRTSATSAPATMQQELFWYTAHDDPDAVAALASARTIDGPLDRDALRRSLTTLVNAHTIFRTAYREVDGRLHQVIGDSRFELEDADLSQLAEPQWDAELARIKDELVRGLDPARGRVLAAQLARLAPDRHVLVLVFHHLATDVQSISTFHRRLFELYADDVAGKPAREEPTVQFLDLAEALVRWSRTAAGQAAAAYWRDRLADVVPVEVAGDFPRDAVDSRRAAAPHGITAEPLHPPLRAAISDGVVAAVVELARVEQTTPRTIYLAALIELLHRKTGQTDICIEAIANMRPLHPGLADVQGLCLTWMLYRVNVAGCTTLRQVVRRTEQVVTEADNHFVIDDYYRLVPHTVRRVVFNHVPALEPDRAVDNLRMAPRPQPLPRWKRAWDLGLNVFETRGAPIAMWTGCDKIFRHATLVALQQSYLDLLLSETRS